MNLRVIRQQALDGIVRLPAPEPAPADAFHAGGLYGRAAESGDDPTRDVVGQIVRQRDRARVLDQSRDGIRRLANFDDGVRATRDVVHGGGQPKPTDGFGQSIVVREHDHLSRERGIRQHAGETFDARGIHGLHGIVDADESEWTLGQRRPWQEQAQAPASEARPGS